MEQEKKPERHKSDLGLRVFGIAAFLQEKVTNSPGVKWIKRGNLIERDNQADQSMEEIY